MASSTEAESDGVQFDPQTKTPVAFAQAGPRVTTPAAMNDAIQQRVEQFVQEILSLVQRAHEESRGAALNKVTTMLAEPRKSADAARSSRGSPGRERMTAAATGEAAPKTSAKSDRRARSALEAAATTPPFSMPRANSTGTPAASAAAAPTVVASSSSESASSGTPSPANDREAAVLDAVRSLVRATASEIAARCGLPNGSVAVTLCGLVARGLVAKAETAQGIEYSLVSAGSVQPFNRARRAAAQPAPAGDSTPSGGSPTEGAPTTTAA